MVGEASWDTSLQVKEECDQAVEQAKTRIQARLHDFGSGLEGTRRYQGTRRAFSTAAMVRLITLPETSTNRFKPFEASGVRTLRIRKLQAMKEAKRREDERLLLSIGVGIRV